MFVSSLRNESCGLSAILEQRPRSHPHLRAMATFLWAWSRPEIAAVHFLGPRAKFRCIEVDTVAT